MKHIFLFILFLLTSSLAVFGQKDFFKAYRFSEADSLRGGMRHERSCYDVTYYELEVRIIPDSQFITGQNDLYFVAREDFYQMQVDLFENMKINKIEYDGRELTYSRKANAVFIEMPPIQKGERGVVSIAYEGKPKVAIKPPWDGGFIFTRDSSGKNWITVSCEGIGASLWWPNKDHLSDEPDSMSMHFTVPGNLYCISNGQFRGKKELEDGYTRYDWAVTYPINNYNVTFYAGDYQQFTDTYVSGDKDTLMLRYYVLPYHLDVAKKHFEQVKPMLACYENYLGKYPFWRDGYALVEAPHLGMEHQSAIAYGNQFKRGYLGGRMPEDMNWDFIIIHESGHEYFGNSLSCVDHAEMWLHEAFTTYLEALYVECTMSFDDAVRYMMLQRLLIKNQEPLMGPPGVNFDKWKSADIYYKGSWMLHTLRNTINQDSLWFDIIKTFYRQHAIKSATTNDFIAMVNQKTGKNYYPFFEQYLFYPSLPKLQYRTKKEGGKNILRYRWKTDVKEYTFPVKLILKKDNSVLWLYPTTEWQDFILDNLEEREFRVARELFLVEPQRVNDNYEKRLNNEPVEDDEEQDNDGN